MKRILASFALALMCGLVHASSPADLRLGAPFTQRERAVLGAETASVVVIEFSSFNCTHCRTFHEEIFPKLRQRYIETGKVQWVIINASNEAADQSSPVFLVARGALHQGKYWELVDQFYQVGLRPPEALAALIANRTTTGGQDLAESLHDPTVRDAVAADFAEYAALKIRGTPTFLLRKRGRDGRWTRAIIEDIQPLGYFQRVLDSLSKEP